MREIDFTDVQKSREEFQITNEVATKIGDLKLVTAAEKAHHFVEFSVTNSNDLDLRQVLAVSKIE